jgi:hypothetical protein
VRGRSDVGGGLGVWVLVGVGIAGEAIAMRVMEVGGGRRMDDREERTDGRE